MMRPDRSVPVRHTILSIERAFFELVNRKSQLASPTTPASYIERYIPGHTGKGAHAGYGKRWFETLKAAVEVIPNPLEGSVSEKRVRQ